MLSKNIRCKTGDMKKTWTPEDLDILALNYPTKTTEELLSLLPGKSKQAIHSKAVLLKLRKKEKRFSFRKDDIKLLTDLYPNTPSRVIAEMIGCSVHSVHNLAFRIGLKKDQIYLSNMNKQLGKSLSESGRETRFHKGEIPSNKGLRQEQYMSAEAIERTKRTRFKKGNLPHNTKYDNAISIRMDSKGRSYKWFRIGLGKWIPFHRHIWEQANGRIPKGYNVQFKDGDPLNCAIENLYLISQADQLKNENSLHARYPEDIQHLIQLKGALNRQINKITKSD